MSVRVTAVAVAVRRGAAMAAARVATARAEWNARAVQVRRVTGSVVVAKPATVAAAARAAAWVAAADGPVRAKVMVVRVVAVVSAVAMVGVLVAMARQVVWVAGRVAGRVSNPSVAQGLARAAAVVAGRTAIQQGTRQRG